jgi:hypothetical protein
VARWKWFRRPDGSVDVVGLAEQVRPPAPPQLPSDRPSWNETTSVLATIDFTPAAMYRLRSASWRWPD